MREEFRLDDDTVAEKILDDLVMIMPKPTKNPPAVHLPRCNSYLFLADEAALVDPGCTPESLAVVMRQAGHDLNDLSRIVLTHYHADHNFSTEELRKRTGAEVLIHEADADFTKSIAVLLKSIGLSRSEAEETYLPIITGSGFKPFKADKTFEDNDVLGVGERQLTVLHTPGHTPGHSCLVFSQEDIVLTGDMTFSGAGAWYGTRVSDLTEMITSVRRLMGMQIELALPGHGPPIRENVRGRLKEYLSLVFERNKKILRVLSKGPTSLGELTSLKLMLEGARGTPVFWEKLTLAKHLELLEKAELAEKRGRGSKSRWHACEKQAQS